MKPSRRPSRAFTLIEALLAMAISLLILGMLQSVLIASSKTLPSSTHSPLTSTLASARLDLLTTDLRDALCILELTPTSLEILLPDRNSDTLPDRVRYQWSGPGQPLIRLVAPSSSAPFEPHPLILLPSATSVTLAPDLLTSPLIDPARHQTSAGLEILGASNNLDATVYSHPLSSAAPLALSTSLSVPSGTTSVRIPRIQLRLARSTSLSGTLTFSLHNISTFSPDPIPLAQRQIPASDIPSSTFSWVEVIFPDAPPLSPSGQYALVITPSADDIACLQLLSSPPSANQQLLLSNASQTSWSTSSLGSLLHRIHLAPTPQSLASGYTSPTETRLQGLNITLQPTNASTPISRYIHAPNLPLLPTSPN